METKILPYGQLEQKDKERIKQLLQVFLRKGEPITDEDIARTMNREGYTMIAAVNEAGEIPRPFHPFYVNLFLGKTGVIDEVVVAPEFQKQGIGTKLLEKAIEVAKEKNMRHIKLDTNADNPANKLYEKVGFIKKNDNVYKLYLV